VLSDCKNGTDKPDDNTLRLTLLYTPGLGTGNGRDYHDQTSQDWGHHEFTYGLAGHAGDWRTARTDWQAQRLNQPLIAFESPRHTGALGRSFSLLRVNNDRVRVLALKQAEESDEVIVRLVELDGKPARDVRLSFAGAVSAAREVNGQEQLVGAATVARGALVTELGPYQLRTFALKLAPARVHLPAPQTQPVALAYDLHTASAHHTPSAAAFDAAGRSLPAEMLPRELAYAGIRFKLASAAEQPNALVARGQTVALPAGKYTRLYLLAAATDADERATFRVGNKPVELTIQQWGGFIGQWDDRQWQAKEVARNVGDRPRLDPYAELVGLKPGFIKRAPVAWFASHQHTAAGVSEPYAYSYLFAYELELPPGTRSLMLPANDKLRIMAITVSDEGAQVRPARPLHDTLVRSNQ
jgi:alpha-mannosidase